MSLTLHIQRTATDRSVDSFNCSLHTQGLFANKYRSIL